MEIIVDLDAAPHVPKGWKVETHQKGGLTKLTRRGTDLYVGGQKVDSYLTDLRKKIMKRGYTPTVFRLERAIQGRPVLNANVLDSLLQHPELIPDKWKRKTKSGSGTRLTFFFGTIYRDDDGYRVARFLYWFRQKKKWESFWEEIDLVHYPPCCY